MNPGENLLIAKTANGFMVTSTGNGDGTTSVKDTYVFNCIEDTYSADSLLGFIKLHFTTKEEE